MSQKGFTLIELLVVVAIIGVLAAVGVVAFNGFTSSAKENVTKQNHKIIVKQFTLLVREFDLNGSINRKVHGGTIQNFTIKSRAFDCPSFQHHFYDIKTPYADSDAIARDQDMQAWGGICCNYGKEGRTYIWREPSGYCTFSTYVDSNKLVYDEVKWSD